MHFQPTKRAAKRRSSVTSTTTTETAVFSDDIDFPLDPVDQDTPVDQDRLDDIDMDSDDCEMDDEEDLLLKMKAVISKQSL